MKKITSVLALAVALVMCVGLMAACTGGNDEPENTTTQTPGTTTGADKDEANKPADDAETKPEGGESNGENGGETPDDNTGSQTPEGGESGEGETEDDATTEGDNSEGDTASK